MSDNVYIVKDMHENARTREIALVNLKKLNLLKNRFVSFDEKKIQIFSNTCVFVVSANTDK